MFDAVRRTIRGLESLNSTNIDDVYIDPQVEPLLEKMVASMAARGPIGSVAPEVMRQRFNEDVAAWNLDLPAIHQIDDVVIECSTGEIPVRVYHPIDVNILAPGLVFIHGGGWVVGDLDTNERTMRALALASGVRIVSVDYPLAPENKFPIALDSCVEVVRWLCGHGRELGIDTGRLAVGGDSAGGNIALATALDIRNSGEECLQLALLIYPALSPDSDSPSHRKFGGGDFGLGSAAMEYFWSQYLPDKKSVSDPRAAPLLADLSGLPPVYLISAGLDALTDDANTLEQQLEASQSPVMHRHYPGVIHGFFSMALFLDVAQRAVAEAATALRELLADAK